MNTPVLKDPQNTQLALSESEKAQAVEIAKTIDDTNPMSVATFGRALAQHTSQYADQLLEETQGQELSDVGKKLTEIIVTAKSFNIGRYSFGANIPVIGTLIQKALVSKEKLKLQFDSTKDQLESLVSEVDLTQNKLSQRIDQMESVYHSVTEEYKLLEIHVNAGNIKLAELSEKIDDITKTVSGDQDAQQLNDLHNQRSMLDKRVLDLKTIQQTALQALPSIRIMQANNAALIDKFHTIKELTLPSWKRQFMLALALDEQRASVQLADSIDDATNYFLKKNAELLKDNTIKTAKANQRLVIDIETMKKAQESLISTFQEVATIQQHGLENRAQASKDIQVMRDSLNAQLARVNSDQKAQKQIH